MKYVVSIILLFVLTNILAQDINKINYQINTGTTLSIPYKNTIETFNTPNLERKVQFKSDFGYFAELAISYNINKKFNLTPSIIYNYCKYKVNDNMYVSEMKGNRTISYLQLPILVKYKLFDNTPLSISIGPYLSLLINANEKGIDYIDTTKFKPFTNDTLNTTVDLTQEYNKDIKKHYKNLDFGISTQIDYEINLNTNVKLMIFSRLNYGLIYTFNNNTPYKWANYNVLIGLGIKI